jgi:hypothetical protein
MFLMPISAEKYSVADSCRIEIACAFPACRQAGLFLSLHKQRKEVHRQTKEGRVVNTKTFLQSQYLV